MDPEFIEATASSRRKLVVFLIAAAALGVGVLELLHAQLDEAKARPICESITLFRWLWIFLWGGLSICGAWVAWLARRALKLDQWPLPGTWVFHRTAIHRGSSARWRASAMLAWSLFTVAGSVYGLYAGEALVHRVVVSCPAARPGR